MTAQTRNYFPDLQRSVTATSSGSNVVSYVSDLGPSKPILTLIHGYPQSSFEWRYVALKLKDHVSLFIPELPGYGISSPAKQNTRKDIAGALLEALKATFNISDDNQRRIIIGGHDRGARISHRIAVSRKEFSSFDIVGAIMLDIVPTKVQWDKFSDPAICAGYYHWPLLANVDIATKIIKAYTGAQWCRDAHDRLAGSVTSLESIKADGAYDVYATLFDNEETIHYSCEDYSSGAAPEYKEQSDDQLAGRKIEVPALVMFSKVKLGSRINVAEEWKEWMAPNAPLTAIGVGGGAGHYLPEEAPEDVSKAILDFLQANQF